MKKEWKKVEKLVRVAEKEKPETPKESKAKVEEVETKEEGKTEVKEEKPKAKEEGKES